jgi:transcription initiation factor IIE alpha subunit
MESSLFVKYLGDSPFVRVLDFLIENDAWDYSVQDISDNTGVARNTVGKILQRMAKLKMIVQTRSIGRAVLFKINTTNPVIKKVISFDRELSLSSIPQKAKELAR